MNDRAKTQPVSVQLVYSVFRAALEDLIKGIKIKPDLHIHYPFLATEDIYKLKLSEEVLPEPAIYDHLKFQRKYKLSEKLLRGFGEFWLTRGISSKCQLRMCQLFFLHEFLHIHQHVDSDTYIYSDNERIIFQFIDYEADAFAVNVSFELERDGVSSWSKLLADVLETHILGGEVFSYVDDNSSTSRMSGGRLRRQMTWLLQYARAMAFKPEANFEDFNIDRQMIVEVFKLGEKGKGDNLCDAVDVVPGDLESPIEIHIVWGGVRLRHHITHEHYTKRLADAVFKGDLSGVIEAFRPLFDDHPGLTGRGSSPSTKQHIPGSPKSDLGDVLSEKEWDDLQDVFCSIEVSRQSRATLLNKAKIEINRGYLINLDEHQDFAIAVVHILRNIQALTPEQKAIKKERINKLCLYLQSSLLAGDARYEQLKKYTE